jgi:hypothetical protein
LQVLPVGRYPPIGQAVSRKVVQPAKVPETGA